MPYEEKAEPETLAWLEPNNRDLGMSCQIQPDAQHLHKQSSKRHVINQPTLSGSVLDAEGTGFTSN